MPAWGLRFSSLRQRIFLVVGVPVVALLLFVVAALGTSLYRNLYQSDLSRIKIETSAAANQIDGWNLETVTVPRVMAAAQEHGMFGDRQASLAYARQILESYPQFTGAYFGYEVDADGHDGAFLAKAAGDEKLAINQEGRFIPYWFRDMADTTRIRLTPLVDMATSFYYGGLKNRVTGKSEIEGIALAKEISSHFNPLNSSLAVMGKTMVTEPYVYESKMIVEQTYPIMINGQFAGVAGVDRSLDEIDDFIRDLKPYRTASFILISHRGRIIAATMDPSLNTQPIEKTPYADLLLSLYKVPEAERSTVRMGETADGKHVFSAARIPTGDWTLVMFVDRDEILIPVWSSLRWVAFIAVVGFVLSLLILAWLAQSIGGSVKTAAEAAGRVAEGDLSVQIVGGGSDETGLLLRAIQRMTTNLNDLIGQVKKSSINVISSATTIAAASKSQEAVAHELGSATTEISAATAEISVTANELVLTMSDVSGMVVETADMARAGHARIEGMDATMRDLSTGADSISTSLSVISDRAQNITGIVTTITKVADQTNLLSLNAAIEAVKAREYGQGFSVVADEIRRLADQTAVAALDIEQIVEEMLGSVSTGIAEMDRFRVQVHKGVDTMEQVSLQLVSIIDRVQDLLPRFGQVNESMQSQSIGVEQISTAMLSLKQVAHSTTSSIGDLNLAVGGLHEAVKALREEVSTFKVQE